MKSTLLKQKQKKLPSKDFSVKLLRNLAFQASCVWPEKRENKTPNPRYIE